MKKENWKNKVVIFEPKNEDIKLCEENIIKGRIPFKIGEQYLCLGEIENMKEHFIYVDFKGRVFWAYHSDFFRLINDED